MPSLSERSLRPIGNWKVWIKICSWKSAQIQTTTNNSVSLHAAGDIIANNWILKRGQSAVLQLLTTKPKFGAKRFRAVKVMAEDLGARSLYLTIVEVFSLVILNILSFAGNSLICISVFSNKRLRTTTNLYIIALAVSDLLSAVFVMPLSAGVLINGRWIYGGAIRQLHAFFSLFVIYVSPVTMGLTAVNRFVRMCKSDLQYNKLFSMHKSLVLVAVVWIFVACYTVVSCLFGLHEYGFVPGYDEDSIVHLSELGKMIHYAIVLSLFFLTPLMATIVSYSKVAKMIRKHNYSASATLERRSNIRAIIERQHSGRRNCLSAHEIKLSKSLFAVVFAFMICWNHFGSLLFCADLIS